MIEAVILLCAVGATDCDERTAEDVVRVKVPPMACISMAPETVAAGMPETRREGVFIKIICKGK